MRLYRALRMAVKALRRNPLRAALTTLGIVIGIGAVIAMMEIGQGSSVQLNKTIASMGANTLLVFPSSTTTSGASQGAGSTVSLRPQDAEALARECPSLRAVAPSVRARVQIVNGSKNWVPNEVVGTTPAWLDIREWPLSGARPSGPRCTSAQRVCLIGQTIARSCSDGESAVGREIRASNVPLRVVGVLATKGANMMGMDQDDILVPPGP